MHTRIFRLSIIIPAYNVERYIGETLDSIVKWSDSRDDVEIVVVDDGSPDNSSTVVTDYQKNHSNIILIKQENKGLGGARNTGIENARGEYVWFVDSDDWLVTENLPDLIELLERERPQALAICASDVGINKEIKQRFDFNDLPQTISGSGMIKKGRLSFCAPFTIYNRTYLNENALRFRDNLFHEDNEFTPRAYFGLKSLYLYNKSLYLVRPNPNSITRSVNFKKNFDLIKVAESLNNFRNAYVNDNTIAVAFDQFICLTINEALFNCSDMPYDDYRKFIYTIRHNRNLFKCFNRSSKLKYRLQGFLFSILPVNPVYIYNGIMKKLMVLNFLHD